MGGTAGSKEYTAADELAEALSKTACRYDHSDKRGTCAKHVLARVDVSQARQRNADEQVADDAGGPGEEPELRISEAEIVLDPLCQHAESDRVEEDRKSVVEGKRVD